MADYKLLYPMPSDQARALDLVEPEYFYHVCVGYRQVFLVRNKRGKNFHVVCRSWLPPERLIAITDLKNKLSETGKDYVIYITSNLNDAAFRFIAVSKHLLDNAVVETTQKELF